MMKDKLREHIEGLFAKAPKTKQAVEIKEEILQNTIDRYNDLIAEGKSEEAAYNISVAGIGDVDHLISNIMAPTGTSGYTKEEIAENKRRRSVLLAAAVALYILSVVPPIICAEIGYDSLGPVLMFVLVAVATALIIYRSGISLNYAKTDDTVVENFKEWNREKSDKNALVKAVNAAISAFIVVIYFLVSFTTGAWYITWLIFLIGGALKNVVKAIFDLTR